MFKNTRTKVVALSLAGALVLGAAVYVTAALATGDASAAPATGATVATQSTAADQAQLRAAVLDMLKDRMGLTGAQAEAFADQMIAGMQRAFPNQDLQGMIDWCNSFLDSGTAGSTDPRWGTFNGGRGMMNWAAPQATPQGTPQTTPQGVLGSMPCFR